MADPQHVDGAQQKRAELVEYLLRVETMLDMDAADEDCPINEDEESALLFVENVLEEIKGSESAMACDGDGSRILEKLLRKCSEQHVVALGERLAAEVKTLIRHRMASHVLQAVVVRVATAPSTQQKKVGAEDASLAGLFLRVCEQLRDDLPSLVSDTYASHVLRAAICVLAGVPPGEHVRSRSSKGFRKEKGVSGTASYIRAFKPPKSFRHVLAAYTSEIMDKTDVAELCMDHLGSPVIQTLLQCLRQSKPSACDELCERIAGSAADAGHAIRVAASGNEEQTPVQEMMTHHVGSHVVEVLLKVASPDLFHSIYTTSFRAKLLDLALHPMANYTVQRLLEFVPTAEAASALLTQLTHSFEDLLAENRTLVVVKTIEAAARYHQHEKQVLKALFDAFHITPEHFKICATLVLALTTTERREELIKEETPMHEDDKWTQAGSMILQALFALDDAICMPVIDSLLSLEGSELEAMGKHKYGSRALEAFLTHVTTPKKKKKLLRRLKSHFTALAVDKFGSHTVDRCWKAADLESKSAIAEELVENEHTLKASFHGKFVARNCRLDEFRRKRKDWAERFESMDRKYALFADIFADEPDKAPGPAPGGEAKSFLMSDAKTAKAAKEDPSLVALGFGAEPLGFADSDNAPQAMFDDSDDSEDEESGKVCARGVTLLRKCCTTDYSFDPCRAAEQKRGKKRKAKDSKEADAEAEQTSKKRRKEKKKKTSKGMQVVLDAIAASKGAKPKKEKKYKKHKDHS
eukprot:m.112597 g.112597  ORF g.112597 m.112597 type:complete len:753 (+) comp9403_c0_seq1:138-2396(+)